MCPITFQSIYRLWEIKSKSCFGLFIENIPLKKQVLLLEEVQKLNRENAEKSGQQQLTPGYLDLEAGVSPKDQQPDAPACNVVDYLREGSQVAEVVEEEVGEKVPEAEVTEKEPKLDVEDVVKEEEKPPEQKKKEVAFLDEEEAKAPELPAAEDKKEPTATR